MKRLGFAFLIICTVSCTSKEEIVAGLRSDDINTIIEACRELRSAEDTGFVRIIFEKPYDPRVCLGAIGYGRTVYEEKMKALSRISGLYPPKPITDKRDSSIVQFYREWAAAKGLIK